MRSARGPRLVTRIAVIVLIVGAALYPRPPANVSPHALLAQALKVNTEGPSAPINHIRQDLREGCIPTLEGSDVISGRDSWAIRLKIAPSKHRTEHPKRYPWLEIWTDKKTSAILAWKEWGYDHGRVAVLAEFPKS